MEYTINKKSISEDGLTITVNVTYPLSTGDVTTDVAIFMPQSLEDITNSLASRGQSEQARIDALSKNQEFLSQL
jgi:hypothetical protein